MEVNIKKPHSKGHNNDLLSESLKTLRYINREMAYIKRKRKTEMRKTK